MLDFCYYIKSRLDAMESTGSRQNANVSLGELLAEKIQCPLCKEAIRDSPVFLCINGHELCNSCRDRQRKPSFLSLFSLSKPCPVCKCELTDVRARPLERILDELPQNANVSVEEFLAEKLECPVCKEAIRDSLVFLCTNGHEMCHTCRDRIKRDKKPWKGFLMSCPRKCADTRGALLPGLTLNW